MFSILLAVLVFTSTIAFFGGLYVFFYQWLIMTPKV